ncbi:MAG TPA: histidine phosphatase family protein, partial [Phycisphaerales bacterium]|nr:histidine phosphatase family protein [Phycisphaerales bacterium]
ETAEGVAARTGAKVKVCNELTGMNLGLWEGLLSDELSERFPTCAKQWRDDPSVVTPPEGETFGEVVGRVLDALNKVVGKARGKGIAMVLRPIEFGVVRCLLSGQAMSEIWTMVEDGPEVESRTVSPGLLKEIAGVMRVEGRA